MNFKNWDKQECCFDNAWVKCGVTEVHLKTVFFSKKCTCYYRLKSPLKRNPPVARCGEEGREGGGGRQGGREERRQGETAVPSRQMHHVTCYKKNTNQGRGVNGRAEKM